MAWGIKKSENLTAVLELHDGSGDRNTTLLLHLHPVRGGMTRGFAALYRACKLNRAAEEKQLLGEGGFTSVGMRDDRKSPAPLQFGLKLGH